MREDREAAHPAAPGVTEEALRRRELELRALFDHTVQFIGLLTREGVLLEVNRAALEFVGHTRDEVVGRPFWEGRWWAKSPQAQGRLREAIAEATRGQSVRYEVESGAGDARPVTLDFSLTPVKDGAGEVALLVAEARDITERRELERQREEWTSIVAHDLRQPVNNLNLWLGVLERQAKRAGCDLADGFEHARAGVKQLDRMISDLLDASRLEAHRLTLTRTPTDLSALVRSVVERAPEDLRPRLRLEPHEPIPPIDVDADRIGQVLANLLASSAKYGSPDTPIGIELASGDGEARVAVVNRGPGLAPDDAEQLFRRFYRAPDVRAGELSGLGLSLYTTRTLVEAHGGRIWLESSPGEATAFRFTLPRQPPSSPGPVRWIPRAPRQG